MGLTNTQAGIVAGAIPLTYIPLALFVGIVVDRFGPGRSMAIGALLFGFGQLGRSIAPDFYWLLVCTIVMGIGATTITFGLPKLVSILFPTLQTGRPTSIYLIAAIAGSAGVFSIGRPVIGPAIGGWRPLFLWSGLIAILYAIGWFILSRRMRLDTLSIQTNESFSLKEMGIDIRLILTHRELQLVVIIGTMYLLINHGMQSWLPTFLESRGVTPWLSGQATSLFVVAYGIGILVIPEISDRFTLQRELLIFSGGFCGVGILLLVVPNTFEFALIGIFLAGLGTGGISPLIRAIPPMLEGIGPRLTATAVGFIFAIGEIGGFLGPFLIGAIYDLTHSYTIGFGILSVAGVCVIIAGGALVLMEH